MCRARADFTGGAGGCWVREGYFPATFLPAASAADLPGCFPRAAAGLGWDSMLYCRCNWRMYFAFSAEVSLGFLLTPAIALCRALSLLSWICWGVTAIPGKGRGADACWAQPGRRLAAAMTAAMAAANTARRRFNACNPLLSPRIERVVGAASFARTRGV